VGRQPGSADNWPVMNWDYWYNGLCNNQLILTASGVSGQLDPNYKALLFAQARLETGNFTSDLYKHHGNMFGMNPAQQRRQYYDSVTASGFAHYASTGDSLADRLNLDVVNSVVYQNPYQYMKAVMSKGYATDPNYIKKWIAVAKSVYSDIGWNTPVFVDDTGAEVGAGVKPAGTSPGQTWILYGLAAYIFLKH